jgi:transcriptional regulator with XRE-family HTH domain
MAGPAHHLSPLVAPPRAIPEAWLEGSFAEWLGARMLDRGVTQRMLAMRAGVSHATISRLLKGDRQPSLVTALALLSVLGPDPIRLHAALERDAG